ncbi:hypothetical protein SVAN01_03749 [Stagonosporopsis vannaccii]|nr:hypothetical protein SVAN01_03749 [Stagonosporopsis vannaccii]
MPRLASGDEKPPMSAEARRWWPAPSDVRLTGGRSDDEPSGVLLRLPGRWLADMAGGGAREPAAGGGEVYSGRGQSTRAGSEAAGDGGTDRRRAGAVVALGRALLLQHQLASKELDGDGRRQGSAGGSRSVVWQAGAQQETRRTAKTQRRKAQRQPRAVVTESEGRLTAEGAVERRKSLHERTGRVDTSGASQSRPATTVSALHQPCASDSQAAQAVARRAGHVCSHGATHCRAQPSAAAAGVCLSECLSECLSACSRTGLCVRPAPASTHDAPSPEPAAHRPSGQPLRCVSRRSAASQAPDSAAQRRNAPKTLGTLRAQRRCCTGTSPVRPLPLAPALLSHPLHATLWSTATAPAWTLCGIFLLRPFDYQRTCHMRMASREVDPRELQGRLSEGIKQGGPSRLIDVRWLIDVRRSADVVDVRGSAEVVGVRWSVGLVDVRCELVSLT